MFPVVDTVAMPPATVESGIVEPRWLRSDRAAVLCALTAIVGAGAALRF
ncbi:MAG: hypothetical protein QOF23_1531, partial [Solirubrobacterales bacterium]|nr:hypothetical protein [Solirubrobacterales bacterium]